MEQLPIVPFGQYKNKPITELLVDTKYCEWLKQQPFLQKHETIYNIIINKTIDTNSKTPIHNKLQNLFLDKKFTENLLIFNYKNLYDYENQTELLKCYYKVYEDLNLDIDIKNNFNIKTNIQDFNFFFIKTIFEEKNWDVVLDFNLNLTKSVLPTFFVVNFNYKIFK